MRFLLTRPVLNSEEIAKNLGDLGFEVDIDPVMNINQIPLAELSLKDYQALIFTSPIGVRSFVKQTDPPPITVYTVGNKTAETVKNSGFQNIINADGDVEKLCRCIINHADPAGGPLLYLRGAHITGDLAGRLKSANFNVQSTIIYEACPSEKLLDLTMYHLKKGAVDYMPFYSRRSALIFIELIKKAGLESCLANISALCLSPAIEKQITHLAWKKILTAKKPTQEDLFKMINVELKG